MDLKDLERIHKEQAERRKFLNVFRRFEESTNLRNVLVCFFVIIVLVFGAYGIKEMTFVPELVTPEEPTEALLTPQELQE